MLLFVCLCIAVCSSATTSVLSSFPYRLQNNTFPANYTKRRLKTDVLGLEDVSSNPFLFNVGMLGHFNSKSEFIRSCTAWVIPTTPKYHLISDAHCAIRWTADNYESGGELNKWLPKMKLLFYPGWSDEMPPKIVMPKRTFLVTSYNVPNCWFDGPYKLWARTYPKHKDVDEKTWPEEFKSGKFYKKAMKQLIENGCDVAVLWLDKAKSIDSQIPEITGLNFDVAPGVTPAIEGYGYPKDEGGTTMIKKSGLKQNTETEFIVQFADSDIKTIADGRGMSGGPIWDPSTQTVLGIIRGSTKVGTWIATKLSKRSIEFICDVVHKFDKGKYCDKFKWWKPSDVHYAHYGDFGDDNYNDIDNENEMDLMNVWPNDYHYEQGFGSLLLIFGMVTIFDLVMMLVMTLIFGVLLGFICFFTLRNLNGIKPSLNQNDDYDSNNQV